ncbi:hypothetical protein YPHTV1_00051 [Halomonas phage YPHTV-1]|nr:hypothetical protein YPHTV1_00051 [Halomonas phage YPHTV-1]
MINLDQEVKKDARKGLISQFVGVLSALLPVLAILGINFDWFNQDFINSLEVLISAVVLFIVNAIAIYKNHFSGKKAQQQNRALKQKGLK